MTKHKSHQHGYGLGLGIIIGAIFGALLGLALVYIWQQTDMLPVSFAAGVAIGLIVGLGLETKYNKRPKPLLDKKHRLLLAIVLFGGILILASMLALFIVANG
ncbi:MAG: hypothetical protein UT86_C0012G0005 [Candidatus Magasanikbacteria bacterium GW2011_GWC2_40_17]|uniref:Glycine zipper-like domain-containing protein n=1 Tax=Candidatus Magasanikbacteria bacterium GW2011_GWA2_42_32 TaxID=1619039 RepID=A0A0G0ZYK8_9BACT|nr:MAG: hypothetical protein UT86_C0012G0005 [Candidatus Magasanikbacteria bacterium GW2011_GWC2_40_17]KKS53749.1 MAG: hypothetical protein UV20_C0046G0006 [Candidatus Magasanikbacteria bacterium GW2011_GWA2_42_32]